MLGPRCSRPSQFDSTRATRTASHPQHLLVRPNGTRGLNLLVQSLPGGSSSGGGALSTSHDSMELTRHLLMNKKKSVKGPTEDSFASTSTSTSPPQATSATSAATSSTSKAGQYRKMSVDKRPLYPKDENEDPSSSKVTTKATLPPPIPANPPSPSVPHSSSINNNLSRHRALVLDCAYRPINVTSWPKAVMMDWTNKAEVVEYYPPPALAQSGQGLHPLPAVIRVSAYVDLHEVAGDVSPTRRNLMTRDKFTCQYCGCKGRENELTLDHVTPASKGGKNTWLNLVTACMPCNQRKGDRLLSHMPGWKLRNVPRKPSPWEIGIVVGLTSGDVERPPMEWGPYLEPYRLKIAELKKRAQEAGVDQDSAPASSSEVRGAAWSTAAVY